MEQHQETMAAQFNARHRVSAPKINVGDWVRVRVPNKRHKTDASFGEPHAVESFVAPFTVLLDNGGRWHVSKLKRCPPPDDEEVDIADNSGGLDDGTLGLSDLPPVAPVPADAADVRRQTMQRPVRRRRPPAWQSDFVTA